MDALCGKEDKSGGFRHCGDTTCDPCFNGKPHERDNALTATKLTNILKTKDEIELFLRIVRERQSYDEIDANGHVDAMIRLREKGYVEQSQGDYTATATGRKLASDVGIVLPW